MGSAPDYDILSSPHEEDLNCTLGSLSEFVKSRGGHFLLFEYSVYKKATFEIYSSHNTEFADT